jgi:hypothetical protein
VGLSAPGVLLGSTSRTVNVLSALLANTGSLTGLLQSGAVSTTGTVTATSLSATSAQLGALTASYVSSAGVLSAAGGLSTGARSRLRRQRWLTH